MSGSRESLLLGRRFIYLDFSRGGLIYQKILEQRSSILRTSYVHACCREYSCTLRREARDGRAGDDDGDETEQVEGRRRLRLRQAY
jgi:hypothetical protein